MFIPKKYGQSKIDICPFCQKHAVALNRQRVPVCSAHKDAALENLKCVCGETLDILNGKFGVFFKCINCGNMNLRKALEFNSVNAASGSQDNYDGNGQASAKKIDSKGKTEITIRSDDPRYFD